MSTSMIFYTANTGVALIDTANSNLDGSGTIVDVITGASNGTYIKSITIKAAGSTSEGMVRLYIRPSGGGTDLLFREIYIPATTQTGVVPAFATMIQASFSIDSGDVVSASTQNSDAFVITADGLDFESCDCV
ncbi:MAG: hypothetical protein H6551_03055 [Chitinophagales bacterium]|nr:hypothetical protein [Chitinophagales bacterium]